MTVHESFEKTRRVQWATAAAVLAAALVACGSGSDTAAEELVGTWVSSDGTTWEVADDSISVLIDSDLVVESMYTATETTLELSNESGPFACPQGQPGTYEWSIDDDVLSLTVVSDECGRKDTLDGISFERAG